MTPAPITLRWRSQDVRIRHDDPRLGPYSPVIQWLQSALTITTTVETLRLVLPRATGYEVRVDDDGGTVRLRRHVVLDAETRLRPWAEAIDRGAPTHAGHPPVYCGPLV